ncbi:hypothetical protein EMIHUDRAFT_221905 [Emiliania huxleyi CCMP1516]|uniref:Kinesin light chain n=2 Tax=Emiliania huxleyi TaxID=2903 RepID=A0A0D3HXL1_EMIH1|nr:hypothetical protein EMIHUDRAFT_221905 [Emiliania huxleyi CCMP1516]EOD03746.1 hypothetical protein EMIHUDRAFT_221905 [Emiliania huxleyi CCMP1516]|eukprot:XP_005756175.1 hypothetical protein EMIHUDRAFT_221905 [Emiliania huxleyi CCMP1516]
MLSSMGFSEEQAAAADWLMSHSDSSLDAAVHQLGARVRELFAGGQFGDALGVAERRLDLCRRTYGSEHAMYATCLNDVATFEQALFEEASKIQKKLLGQGHPHTIATLQNLAALYTAKGDAPKAEAMQLLVQALQLSSSGGGDGP